MNKGHGPRETVELVRLYIDLVSFGCMLKSRLDVVFPPTLERQKDLAHIWLEFGTRQKLQIIVPSESADRLVKFEVVFVDGSLRQFSRLYFGRCLLAADKFVRGPVFLLACDAAVANFFTFATVLGPILVANRADSVHLEKFNYTMAERLE